jgi:hypothetical protein
MAKHRIRRWLQFGVLDLLLLTTVVAVVAVLWRPAHAKSTRGWPWIYGTWAHRQAGNFYSFIVFPTGFFADGTSLDPNRWKLTREEQDGGRFVLACGEKQFLLQDEADGWKMELFDNDGKVQRRLKQVLLLEGQFRNGTPDGAWKVVDLSGERDAQGSIVSITYRRGEPIDAGYENGGHALEYLNALRQLQGLPPQSAHDFAPGEKTP